MQRRGGRAPLRAVRSRPGSRSASSSPRRCSTGCAPATTTASSASSSSCPPGCDAASRSRTTTTGCLPLRELHDPDPLHRGGPRAGPDRAASGRSTCPSTPPTRRAGPAAAQPRGAMSLRWLRGAARRGDRGPRPDRGVPGLNDGDALDDTLAGILDRYPTLATVAVRAPRRQPLLPEDAMRPHTRRGGRGGLRGRGQWQAASWGARPAHGLRRRRVLPDGRAAVPRRRRPTTGSPSTRTGSGWPAPSRPPSAAPGPGPRGPAGFFAWVDGAPRDGYRAPTAGSDSATPGTASGAGRHRDRRVRRRGAGPARRRARTAADIRLVPVANRFFGGNIAVSGLLTGIDVAEALGDRAGRAPLPAARRLLSEGRFLDDLHGRRPAASGRGRGHRRAVAPARPRGGRLGDSRSRRNAPSGSR